MKYYDRRNIPFAKELRKNATIWERKLWFYFLRQYPVRFQRQKAIGAYIVDFYAAKVHLAIELDGSEHYEIEKLADDQKRTRELTEMGVHVVRFSNLDVDKNFHAVCEEIDRIVSERLTQETGE